MVLGTGQEGQHCNPKFPRNHHQLRENNSMVTTTSVWSSVQVLIKWDTAHLLPWALPECLGLAPAPGKAPEALSRWLDCALLSFSYERIWTLQGGGTLSFTPVAPVCTLVAFDEFQETRLFSAYFSKTLIAHSAVQHLLQLRLSIISSLDSLHHNLAGVWSLWVLQGFLNGCFSTDLILPGSDAQRSWKLLV